MKVFFGFRIYYVFFLLTFETVFNMNKATN